MATRTAPIDRDELVRIIRTGEPIRSIGPVRAIGLLSGGDVAHARNLLVDVVVDRELDPRLRIAAAQGLYRSAGPAPGRLLAEMASHADKWTAAPLAMGLGRTGSADLEPSIARLKRLAPAHLRGQVAFAQTLFSYRHRLDTYPVRTPRAQQLQDPAPAASAIGITAAARGEATAALKALEADPVDVDLVTDAAHRIDCEPNTFVWLWNRAALAAPEHLEANTVAGVLTRQNRFDRGHTLSRIALLTPRRSTTTLTIHRATTGAIEYAGSISARGALTLRATKLPGLAAIAIEGQLSDHDLHVETALSASTVLAARVPAAG